MPVLAAIDVLGVQRYVFASNRLRDAVAASWVVHWATAADGALDTQDADRVLLAGGANAILRFEDIKEARAFAAAYTRRLYEQAPGLEAAIAHRSYEAGSLADALAELRDDLARAKRQRRPSVPQLGLSVTAPCRITGLPAVGTDPLDPSIPLSRIVLRWRDETVRRYANERWHAFLDGPERFAFPREIDDMGRSRGETSLLGVVHVDGNEVGQKIESWLRRCRTEGLPDDTVTNQLRNWSRALDELGRKTLKGIVRRVTDAVVKGNRIVGEVPELSFDLREEDGRTLLPLRPVLLGGDDLTFLCDGRIALDLAEQALECLTAKEIPELGTLSACAGVAIVPVHAPFERAYELAEALCRSAKQRRKESGDSGSWIDWHIGAPRPGESVEALRARAYTRRWGATALRLTCRPYRLGREPAETETWRWLSGTVLGTGNDGFRGPRWSRHRNKIKELGSLVREGSDGIERARQAWSVAGELSLPGGLDAGNGFFDASRTPLLDAVELMDLHLPLSGRAKP
jgi:hypothetical protein